MRDEIVCNEAEAAPAEAPRAAQPTAARIADLGRLLRGVGAAVLLAAASTFLIQHWQAGDDLQRYAGLLALTAFLSAAGFFTGIRLGETKGARTFLALAAGVVPAHFCVLGGLVYSRLAWGSGPHPVPAYATWVAPSAGAALATVAVALAVLAPVVLVSMLALARSRARSLTCVYLGCNALLLVPSREPQVVAVLLAGAIALLGAFELRTLRRDVQLRTFEGLLVRLMLTAPPVLLVLRSALHYDVSSLLAAVVSAGLAAVAFALSRESGLGRRVRLHLELGAALAAGFGCTFGALALEAVGLPNQAVIPMAALPFAGCLAALSLATSGDPGVWRRAAAGIALLATAVNLAAFETAFAAFTCLAASVAALAYGFLAERRVLLLAGAAGALFALAHHVHVAIRLYAWSSWGSLALLGVTVIVAASLLERNHEAWSRRVEGLRGRLAGGGATRA